MHTSPILFIKTNTENACSTPITDIICLCYIDFNIEGEKVPMLFIYKNVFQGPLIPFTHFINVKPSGARRGDVSMKRQFPSLYGVTDASTPCESPIYNLLFCCLGQLAYCCLSTFRHSVMLCEAVPLWALAAFLLNAVCWCFPSSLPHHLAAVILLSSVFCGCLPSSAVLQCASPHCWGLG